MKKNTLTPPPAAQQLPGKEKFENYETCQCEFRIAEDGSLDDLMKDIFPRKVLMPDSTSKTLSICIHCEGIVAKENPLSDENRKITRWQDYFNGFIKNGQKISDVWYLWLLILTSGFMVFWLIIKTIIYLLSAG